ncbi:hypothetical protein ACN28S_42645 [Cystobacter fuscus]
MNDEAVKDAVRRACEDVGLPLAYRFAVSQLLRTPPADWPTCCGEGCFPAPSPWRTRRPGRWSCSASRSRRAD